MSRTVVFWILMLLWVLSLLGVIFEVYSAKYGYHVNSVFLLLLFGLLGWDVYGPALKGK